jgi:hypothetical protein
MVVASSIQNMGCYIGSTEESIRIAKPTQKVEWHGTAERAGTEALDMEINSRLALLSNHHRVSRWADQALNPSVESSKELVRRMEGQAWLSSDVREEGFGSWVGGFVGRE